jgi:oligosaccharyltransferase complex subunit epsilon
MPPKQRVQAIPGTMASPQTQAPTPSRSSKSTSSNANADAQDILQGVWNKYVQKTPQRTKLLDTFMAFLVVVGALQFLYVVLVGNFVRSPLEESWLDGMGC